MFPRHLLGQEAQLQDASLSAPISIPVLELYLSSFFQRGGPKIIITLVEENWQNKKKVPVELILPNNYGFLELDVKYTNIHRHFFFNTTIEVSGFLLRRSSTVYKDPHDDDRNIIYINTGEESDCHYLYKEVIKNKYTVINALFLTIIDTNGLKQKLILYPHNDIGTPFHCAVVENNVYVTEILIQHKLDINAKNKMGLTPLHTAVDLEMTDIVDLLINNGADVNAQTDKRQVPLHFAAKKNNSRILIRLFESQANLNAKDMLNQTPLFYAITAGNVDIVEIFLRVGANSQLKDSHDCTPFRIAVQRKNADIIEVFLQNNVNVDIIQSIWYLSEKINDFQFKNVSKETYIRIINILQKKGAKINFRGPDNRTPLQHAVVNDDMECMQALIECSANMKVCNRSRKTLLHLACQHNAINCIPILLETDIDISAVDVQKNTALSLAVYAKNYGAVELILKKYPNVNISNSLGKQILCLAIKSASLLIIRILINNKVSENLKFEIQKAPHLAIKSGCLSIAEFLLEKKVDVNAKDVLGQTALQIAIESAPLSFIKLLLANDADVNLQDASGKTALHLAIKSASLAAVELLLEKKVDVNTKDVLGKTALHLATESAHLSFIKLLLANNADINLQDASGKTVLHLAIQLRLTSIIELLLQYKPDVNLKDDLEKTALHLVSDKPNIPKKIIEFILQSTNDVNAKDILGRTAIHYAVLNNNISTLKCLLEASADVNVQDIDERTPLHVTIAWENSYVPFFECIKILVNYKIDINSVDNESTSLLHLACLNKNVEIVEYLLKNGADSSIIDKHGRTVFHYACMNKFNRISLSINDIEKKFENTLQVLFDANVSVNCVDVNGKTPLHYALEDKLLFMCRPLLIMGADINIVDKNLYSPVDDLIAETDNFFIYHMSNNTTILLKQHIIGMKVLGLEVRQSLLDNIYQVDNREALKCIELFEFHCNKELELMQNTKLYQNNVTYYDFLSDKPCNVVAFTLNNSIVKALQSNKLETMFPFYWHFLKSQLREAQQVLFQKQI